jgi:DNA-binding NarL/FixJ family response regulator
METSTKNPWAVYIIGTQKLQNELIAFHLQAKTGIPCHPCADTEEARALVKENQRVIILCDCLGKSRELLLESLEAYSRKCQMTSCEFVFFNVSPEVGIEVPALERGVSGVCYDSNSPECLVKVVTAVLEGELWFSRQVISKYILNIRSHDHGGREEAGRKNSSLTAREEEVLLLIASGATNEEIAEQLYISTHTVKSHVYRIFQKIDVPNRLQAALWAVKNL